MLQNQCTVSGLAKGKGCGQARAQGQLDLNTHRSLKALVNLYTPINGGKGGSPAVDPSVDLCREVDNISRTVTQGEGRSWPSTSMGAPPGGMQVPPSGKPAWPFQGMPHMGQPFNNPMGFLIGVKSRIQFMCPLGVFYPIWAAFYKGSSGPSSCPCKLSGQPSQNLHVLCFPGLLHGGGLGGQSRDKASQRTWVAMRRSRGLPLGRFLSHCILG